MSVWWLSTCISGAAIWRTAGRCHLKPSCKKRWAFKNFCVRNWRNTGVLKIQRKNAADIAVDFEFSSKGVNHWILNLINYGEMLKWWIEFCCWVKKNLQCQSSSEGFSMVFEKSFVQSKPVGKTEDFKGFFYFNREHQRKPFKTLSFLNSHPNSKTSIKPRNITPVNS